MSKLSEVSETTEMNEFEIVYWSILLDKIEWDDYSLDFEKLLKVTAFQTKVHYYD